MYDSTGREGRLDQDEFKLLCTFAKKEPINELKCLMPLLYLQLSPMSKSKSLDIQEPLANAFRVAGIRAEGGKKSRRIEA
jgi:hypothetical protein